MKVRDWPIFVSDIESLNMYQLTLFSQPLYETGNTFTTLFDLQQQQQQ